MRRTVVERVRVRPRQSGGSRTGRGPALGLSFWHGWADDRRYTAAKVLLLALMMLLIALLEVPR